MRGFIPLRTQFHRHILEPVITDTADANAHACCVVLASKGYPTSYQKGFEITMSEEAEKHTYVAGAALKDGKLVTSGGRVLGVTAVRDTLKGAIDAAYALSNTIHFENAFCRRDIGARALKAQAEE